MLHATQSMPKRCGMPAEGNRLIQSTVFMLIYWRQIIPTAMLWGTGTAMGEIPPYAFSYHAAKAGKHNEELDSLFEVCALPARLDYSNIDNSAAHLDMGDRNNCKPCKVLALPADTKGDEAFSCLNSLRRHLRAAQCRCVRCGRGRDLWRR